MSSEPITNDNSQLTPATSFDGPALRFDFPSLQIGVAEYPEGPTGCTVLYFPGGARTAVDIRGGSHATYFTESLHAGEIPVHAICLAGGSLLGLEAAAGVAAELFAMKDYSAAWKSIPLVTGAIIYDFLPRANSIYPDKALGRAALRGARPGVFPLHGRGAGCSATVGKWLPAPYQREMGGQGAAFRRIGETRIAVFTVANSVGAIVNREGKVVRGHFNPETRRRDRIAESPFGPGAAESGAGADRAPVIDPARPNTTLTAVVTNQKLDSPALRQLAREAHSSLARAIEPFHTISDGDILWAATTDEIENPEVNYYRLSFAASETAWDAVLNSFAPEEE
ncbi:MAG TPA: P1 family peptidase [Sumerlaeia bacterium]|nr:P1 family peptidase [Sumerlaeia bacterium]